MLRFSRRRVILLLQLLILTAAVVPHPHSIQKRHLLQLCNLIADYTGRGCLVYNNYGCYCGIGNAASQPADDVDNCCRIHDQCYGEVSCYWLYPHFVGFNFECKENATLCQCTDSPITSLCEFTTCRCDLEFAECLSKSTYNHQFKDYDREKCKPESQRGRRSLDLSRKRRGVAKNQEYFSLRQKLL